MEPKDFDSESDMLLGNAVPIEGKDDWQSGSFDFEAFEADQDRKQAAITPLAGELKVRIFVRVNIDDNLIITAKCELQERRPSELPPYRQPTS